MPETIGCSVARATLTFYLPDEADEFRSALHGGQFKSVLWSLDQHLRNRIKHEELSGAVHDALQQTRDELHAMLREHGCSLDE